MRALFGEQASLVRHLSAVSHGVQDLLSVLRPNLYMREMSLGLAKLARMQNISTRSRKRAHTACDVVEFQVWAIRFGKIVDQRGEVKKPDASAEPPLHKTNVKRNKTCRTPTQLPFSPAAATVLSTPNTCQTRWTLATGASPSLT